MNGEKNGPFVQNETKQKGQTNPALLVICAIVIIIVAVAGYYFSKVNSARYIFDKEIINFLSSDSDKKDYNTLKTNTEISINVESDEATFIDDLIDFINNSKFTIKAEVDKESEEAVVGLKLDNNKNNLLDANVKLDMESKDAYLNLGDLFSKTIKVDATEIIEDEFDISSTEKLTLGQMINASKAKNIFKKEIKKELSDEYFSSSKEKIDNKNLTKDTLKISEKEFVQIINNICNDLMTNKEFLECFEEPDEIIELLQKTVDDLKDVNSSEDVIFEISVYSNGLSKNIQRVDFVVKEDNEEFNIQINKVDNDTYEYVINLDGDEIKGTVKITENGNNKSLNIVSEYEGIKISLNINFNQTYNESLTNINTNNAVDIENLSYEDMEELSENLMNSDLYKSISSMISPFMFGNSYNMNYDDNDDNNFSDNFLDDEDDNNKRNSTSKLNENEVKTYDDDLIKFEVPDSFEEYSNLDSEHYRLFKKQGRDGTVDVDVSARYDTIDDYIQNIQNKVDSYGKEDYYENVSVSDVETIEVNGNTFKKISFSYDYKYFDGETKNYITTYYAYEIDKDNLYTVEIENPNLINSNELESFLTIEK